MEITIEFEGDNNIMETTVEFDGYNEEQVRDFLTTLLDKFPLHPEPAKGMRINSLSFKPIKEQNQ